MKHLTLATLFALCTGCATSSATYAPDGSVAHAIQCSGIQHTWAACYEKAGAICGPAGYDELRKDGDQQAVITVAVGGQTTTRSLLVRCRQ